MKKVTKISQTPSPAKEQKKLRVAAYCRVSTGSDAQLESLDTQKTHYEKYISSRKTWELAGVYYDEGITGTKKDKRPALMQLIDDCENGKVDMVITKSLSRFSRNTTDCLELVRKLQTLNIPIYFERENLNTGAMESELILSILSGVAEGESKSTSENTKWAAQKRFKNGTFKISYPPYGYDFIDGEMKINPEQAKVVKQIFADYLSGIGIYHIAEKLNQQGVPSKRDKRWTHSTVRGILSNEKFTGDVIFQKSYTDSQFNRHINNGEKDQYYCPNHHEAIISHEDFETAVALTAQHSMEKGIVKSSAKYLQRYSFSGNIICGECGNTFRRRIHTCQKHKYVAWVCNTHLTDKNSCSILYIKDEGLKQAFVTMMNKLIYARKLILLPLLETLKSDSKDSGMQRIREYENELMQLTERRQTLQRLMASGYLDQIIYTKQKNELMTQTEHCQHEIEILQKAGGQSSDKIQELNKLIRFADHTEMLQDFEEALFTEYAERIIVYSRHEIGFCLKCGLTLRERM